MRIIYGMDGWMNGSLKFIVMKQQVSSEMSLFPPLVPLIHCFMNLTDIISYKK